MCHYSAPPMVEEAKYDHLKEAYAKLEAELVEVKGERDEWKGATSEAWDIVHSGWKLFEKEAEQYEHPTGEVFYQCPDPECGYDCSCNGDIPCPLMESKCEKFFLVEPINALADAKQLKEIASRAETAEALAASLKELVESVEWVNVYTNTSGDYACPWCENFKEDGHAPDCPRQLVLKGKDSNNAEEK